MHGHTELSNVADNEEVDLENEVEKLKAVKETNENQMMDNIDQAQTRQKKYYNRRNVMTKEYNVGDNVLLKNFRRKHGLGTVEQVRYTGPYVIDQYCSNTGTWVQDYFFFDFINKMCIYNVYEPV